MARPRSTEGQVSLAECGWTQIRGARYGFLFEGGSGHLAVYNPS